MVNRTLFLACGMAVVAGLLAPAEDLQAQPATQPGDILRLARQAVRDDSGAMKLIGLAEVLRSAGRPAEAMDALDKAAGSADAGKCSPRLQELICWRLMPVGAARLERFRQAVAALEKAGASDWLVVFRLYLAGMDSDRAAMLRLARDLRPPGSFPTPLGEQTHLALLTELHVPRTQAGLEVVARRAYEPLYALRDLDRSLCRELSFLTDNGQKDQAAALTSARDRLRQAYLSASANLIERLFALNLLEMGEQRDRLLTSARSLPYLTNPDALAGVLAGLTQEQAWSRVVAPLLEGDLKLIESPPQLQPTTQPSGVLTITADRKSAAGSIANYQGGVHIRLDGLLVRCDTASTVALAEQANRRFVGAGNVVITGVPGYGRIACAGFTFTAGAAAFVLDGDVRLEAPGGALKLTSCTLTAGGEIRDRRSPLTDLAAAQGIRAKLLLLPKIAATYDNEELAGEPDSVKYLLAMELLRGHLSWHRAPEVRADADESVKVISAGPLEDTVRRLPRDDAWRWADAHPGEPWMPEMLSAKDLPAPPPATASGPGKSPGPPTLYWRIKDPGHADVARAKALLEKVAAADLAEQARRWLAEIERNNTVVTFDLPGGFAKGKDARFIMDVRNADKVSFKLYRAGGPDDVLFAAGRVGTDFIYRDYGLDGRGRAAELSKALRDFERKQVMLIRWAGQDRQPPAFNERDLAGQWEVNVAELEPLPRWQQRQDRWQSWDDDWGEGQGDEEYFDDRCEQHRARLEKRYRHYGQDKPAGGWACDRIVAIPGRCIDRPGGYVLVAQANGQTVYAPIIVEPLSLTLRRCRDGVFALVSTPDGKDPVKGARILGSAVLDEAATDGQGAAFARIFAGGDVPILAESDGRYALGGFGRVFDGIYVSPYEHLFYAHRLRKQRALRQLREGLQVFADRRIVAAYTDRPVYRPGQEVQFKLIVRQLSPQGPPGEAGPQGEFRAGDFDVAAQLALPAAGQAVRFDAIDPRGRVLPGGELALNDFGTCAGKLALSGESATGNYSLRLTLDGADHVVPDVFAVQYYRRPNFQVALAGVPEKVRQPGPLTVAVSGKYYFGKPVAAGKVEARLVHADQYKPLAGAVGALDDKGELSLTLDVPRDLPGATYHVICAVTDDTGRTVTHSLPYEVERPAQAADVPTLAALPRFVPFDKPFKLASLAEQVEIRQTRHEDSVSAVFKVRDGAAEVRFPFPGWYSVLAGNERTEIYAYGGTGRPARTIRQEQLEAREKQLRPDRTAPPPREWVNLTRYAGENGDEYLYEYDSGGRLDDPHFHLLAMFDQYHAQVGGKLRLLVYVPFEKARLLLTVEGRTILDYLIVNLPESKDSRFHIIEIPVKQRYLPNFYLQGRIIWGEGLHLSKSVMAEQLAKALEEQASEDDSEDPRWCRVDVVDPQAAPGGEKLKVAVRPERDRYQPGEKVNVAIEVTDLAGLPAQAEVSLAAVDESVFSFRQDAVGFLAARFDNPHPSQRFLPKSWRSALGGRWSADKRLVQQLDKVVSQQASLAMAMESAAKMADLAQMRQMLDAIEGGPIVPPLAAFGMMPATEIPLARLRTDFRETAAWQPQLRTGPDGRVATSFVLPDSLTGYRLTAVGLDKATRIGTARANLLATRPVSVQVFLPRFAVQKDRLLAVALVHNNTGAAVTADAAWEVAGAAVDSPAEAASGWQMRSADGRTTVSGKVDVPAGSSARVGLWIRADQPGQAKLAFRAAAGNRADAEQRALDVQPMGRQREVVLTGQFNGGKTVNLPAGFYGRDVTVTLSRAHALQAMEGLGYLVDYPYGCVEQTMSRFLPAVMVKHAVQQTAAGLPPDVEAKLPDVLQRGLARLYNFQHPDGGWGWWEKDQTNNAMTVYVLYGLARCRATGTPVDAGAFRNGCNYLKTQLANGALANQSPRLAHGGDSAPGNELESRAWLVLAMAGEANENELSAYAAGALVRPIGGEARCNLALACKYAGLPDLADRLYAGVKDWQALRSDQLALKLLAQSAFDAPLAECNLTVAALLAQRTGGRWESTQSTSWAIEAIAGMLRYVRSAAAARSARIVVAGATVLEARTDAELRGLVHSVKVPPAALTGADAAAIEMKLDCDEGVNYSIAATGIQQLDVVEPIGTDIKLSRRYLSTDGVPIDGAVKVGRIIAAHVTVELAKGQDYVIVEDRRPAGCEFAEDRLFGPAANAAAHVEFRDDRVCAFFGRLAAGRHELVYYLRAETPGLSHVLPGCAYPMYNDKTAGQTGAGSIEIDK